MISVLAGMRSKILSVESTKSGMNDSIPSDAMPSDSFSNISDACGKSTISARAFA